MKLTEAEARARILKKLTPLEPYPGFHARWRMRCECSHEWNPLANNLLQGRNCPECADYGFQTSRPAIVYYVRFAGPNGYLYKIGITNRSIKERFIRERREIKTVQIWSFETGEKALNLETKILLNNRAYLYHGPPILMGTGNDEVFVCDVLNLDKPESDLF